MSWLGVYAVEVKVGTSARRQVDRELDEVRSLRAKIALVVYTKRRAPKLVMIKY